MKKPLAYCSLLLVFLTPSAQSEEIGCITTTWKLIGSNHKVCVQAFDDPKVKD
jgi:CreA protein